MPTEPAVLQRATQAPQATAAPLLQVEQLSVAFDTPQGRQQVVDQVSFALHAGEKLALVGESGSGKSVTAQTILRLLDGHAVHYAGGRILWQGDDLLQASARRIRQVRGREIAMIFQEPMTALNPLLTVGDQIAEVLELHEGLSRRQARTMAIDWLAKTGIPEPARRVDAYPHQLSGGQRQRAMIAMALACRPQLLLADEPTTALDKTVQQQILDLLHQLQREFSLAVLLISHDLPLVRRFAERVAVMQSGCLVEQGTVDQVFQQPSHAYTRKLLDSIPERMVGEAPPPSSPVLVATGVRKEYQVAGDGWWGRSRTFVALEGMELQVGPGETLAIVGESGSGKTTLGLSLLRLLAASGQITVHGQDWHRLRQRQLRPLRRDFQVVFQDPYASLSPRMLVRDIVAEGLRLHEPKLDHSAIEQRVRAMLEEVGLPADALYRYPHEFSGGQRQRIAIARALILNPKVVLLDEPTSALDVTVQKQILVLLRRLQEKHGLSYLLITHDLQLVHALAHRVMVMQHGRLVELGAAQQVLGAPREAYTRQLVAAAGLLEAGSGDVQEQAPVAPP